MPRMRTAITTSFPASTKEMLPRCRMAATWLFKKSPSFDFDRLEKKQLNTIWCLKRACRSTTQSRYWWFANDYRKKLVHHHHDQKNCPTAEMISPCSVPSKPMASIACRTCNRILLMTLWLLLELAVILVEVATFRWLLVDQESKRHFHPLKIHVYFWHLHPILVVVCSVHVRVRARERCQLSIAFSEN